MTAPTHRSRPTPATLALLCFLVPVLTVHLSYGLSIAGGFVAVCIPYLDGCASVSATGRHGLGYVLFKAGMLPSVLLLIMYWRLCRDWLLEAGDVDGPALRSLLRLGIAGALFLALYTVFLGHKGEVYNLLRRFGVSLNLGFTYLAQLLVVWRLRRLRERDGQTSCPGWLLQAKTWLVTVLLLLGLGSIPVSNFIADKDPVENAIEWTFCLLMSCFYLLTALAWRETGWLPSRGRLP